MDRVDLEAADEDELEGGALAADNVPQAGPFGRGGGQLSLPPPKTIEPLITMGAAGVDLSNPRPRKK